MSGAAAAPVRGVIEGFYGVYYTFQERDDMIRYIGSLGFNQYVYGPKNDRQHRMRWREPYPEDVMESFSRTVKVAEEAGVSFVYSIGSGVTMSYASEEDFRLALEKFEAFYRIGVRDFSILLDDIASEFKHPADGERYGSFAEAHADVCNRLFAALQARAPACTLSMCPTDYHGAAPFSAYLHELGERMRPEVAIYYTGEDICAKEIRRSDAEAFGTAARRKPVIWDNYPVNDLAMRPELHVGPIRGREAGLLEAVDGYVVNLMAEAEASKIALATFADYFRDPVGYDPERSWTAAVERVAGEKSAAAFRLFAEQSLESCLGEPNSVRLNELTQAVLGSFRSGTPGAAGSEEVRRLEELLTAFDEGCYHLKNRMSNVALRNNSLLWIETLEHWLWMARRALLVLAAIERGEGFEGPLRMMKESLEEIDRAPKRMTDGSLRALAAFALERAEAAGTGKESSR
ncbi:protein O-GlcNAcase [Paenibacillus sp.]|uniref:protein O-GlcNAcase n=1 Tax=Paenibacillus sp. TaxID=58172 RepID=UPI002812861B|nr:protein O-GlcNAcase [Paenibacillus sp.]